MQYISRHIENVLTDALETFSAVIIEGPKWCGKTTTAKRFAKSALMLSDPTNDFENKARAQLDPKLAISGDAPRLLDEWQDVPKLWDAVRFSADEKADKGMFILTGSATPRDLNSPIHTGTGRFGRVKMATMTLEEMGLSRKTLSLRALFEKKSLKTIEKVHVGALNSEAIAQIIVRGGWPGTLTLNTDQAKKTAEEYVSTICEVDISEIDNTKRDPVKVRSLLASLARNESTYASLKTITNDVGVATSRQTVSEYIALLQRMHICENITAWNPALRSPLRLRQANKLHLADVSLVAAALGANESSLLNDFKTLGLLFESLVLHDLKVYAQNLGAKIFQYHDASDLEVDAILEKTNGDWIPVEIKLGATQAEDASLNLEKFTKKITAAGNKPPLCKIVVFGFGVPTQPPADDCIFASIDSLCC